MNIAVIGAAGAVGKELVQQIVADRILSCDERLTLVGNASGSSRRILPGFAVDIQDAYAEICPKMDILFDPKKIRADLIIMAGGATLEKKNSKSSDRNTLAENNLPIFETYASALGKYGSGHEIVLCVSNPNELAVSVFAHYLGSRRVIGMGAFLDSLRFRKEIALDLGIKRQRIHGFMVGEHGAGAVPLWSSIHIHGYETEELQAALTKIRKEVDCNNFQDQIRRLQKKLQEFVFAGKIREAYRLVDQYPPDMRVILKPFITHFSGSKTVMGTSRATLDLIRTITMGADALISGQVALQGEFYGIHGTIGVPFVAGNKGVDRIIQIAISDDELEKLQQTAQTVQDKIAKVFPKAQPFR